MKLDSKFHILYQSLVDGNKEYVDFISKVIAIILISIGWFVAKDDPFPWLSDQGAMWAALIGVFLGAVAICWVSIFHYLRSSKRFELLKSLDYCEENVFSHYKITKQMIAPVIFIHAGLFTGLWMLVFFKYG